VVSHLTYYDTAVKSLIVQAPRVRPIRACQSGAPLVPSFIEQAPGLTSKYRLLETHVRDKRSSFIGVTELIRFRPQ
jgi:hypothetical protein